MNPSHKIFQSLSLCGLLGLLSASASIAGTTALISDDFTGVTSSTLNDNGWYYQAGGGGTAWQIGDAGSYTPLVGNCLYNPGGSTGWSMPIKQFSTTSLVHVGDYIKLTLDVVLADTANIHLELLNSSATISANVASATLWTVSSANSTGYSFTQGASSTGSTAPSYAKVNQDGRNAGLYGPTLTTLGASNLTAGTAHEITFQMTLVATGVEISSSLDGVSQGSYIDTTSSTTAFNTFLFQGYGTDLVDNVSVTSYSAVPEPSTVFLGCVGLGVLAIFTHKRRKLALLANS